MKKIIYSIMAFAIAVFTLTSCESVPMPYDFPEQGSSETVAPEGDGSLENPFNVAGVVAYVKELGADVESDKEVYVKGIVSANSTSESTITSYGNMTFTMVDAGTSSPTFTAFQVYGPNKKKFTSVDQIQVGQEVVVCGKVYLYSGSTPETVGKGSAYVVSINGEGGAVGPSTDVEPAGTGTASDPYNVSAAVDYINTLGSDVESDKEIYVKGKVLTNNTTEATITSYGNMTFTMIDEGNTSKTFTAFQVYGPGKKKFTSVDQIKEGMDVVVCGKVVNYRGNTPETVGKGSAYVVSINGEGGSTGGDDTTPGEAKGTGTASDPFNVAAAVKKAEETGTTETSTEYYVKGVVLANNTTDATISSYGNMTFTMVDEGTTTPVFTAFQVYGPGKEKFTSVDQIKPGQTVVVCGKIVNYKGNTPETVGKGASYVVSIDGEGSTTGGGDTGGTTGTSDGISVSGTTVTLNNAAVTAGTETVVCTVNDLGIADKASAEGTYTLSDGSTLTVAKGDGKSGPTYYAASNGFRIYASNTLTFDCKNNVATIVFECDSYNGTNYVGNETATVTFNGKNVVYCNKNDANSGGVQLRVKKITITYAQ